MQLQTIQNKIYETTFGVSQIRGQNVMLDFDLAELYEVETRVLKQAVRRNIERFPEDFLFELTKEEYDSLRSQIVTLETGRGKHSKYNPFAFTEQGVAMLSGVLKSTKAIQVNIAIMRAFVFMRQYALSHKDLTEKLKEIETKYDKNFEDIYQAINYLIGEKEQELDLKNRKRIGFKEK
jgi:hypothetical protein